MSDRPPFDPLRAAFWLLAFVIGVYSVVVLGMSFACIWHSEFIITNRSQEVNCDPNSRLMGLLAAALAAALAFAGVSKK